MKKINILLVGLGLLLTQCTAFEKQKVTHIASTGESSTMHVNLESNSTYSLSIDSIRLDNSDITITSITDIEEPSAFIQVESDTSIIESIYIELKEQSIFIVGAENQIFDSPSCNITLYNLAIENFSFINTACFINNFVMNEISYTLNHSECRFFNIEANSLQITANNNSLFSSNTLKICNELTCSLDNKSKLTFYYADVKHASMHFSNYSSYYSENSTYNDLSCFLDNNSLFKALNSITANEAFLNLNQISQIDLDVALKLNVRLSNKSRCSCSVLKTTSIKYEVLTKSSLAISYKE